MIDEKSFENGIARNVERVTHYEKGGDGSGDGGCDCVGLVIGALRLAGGEWKWTHGSNYAARYRTKDLRKIASERDLKKNSLVYKGKQPGDSGYGLPDIYKDSGDLTDYYHIGIVTRTNPLRITHCTSVQGGIREDAKIGDWKYTGWLDQVKKDGEIMDIKTYKVVGGTLFLRRSPSQSASVLKRMPNGSIVTSSQEEENGWLYVDYEGTMGYCMTKFLEEINDISYDDDTLGAAIETAFSNVYAALDELKMIVTSAL